ncbi:MAG: response regulator [Pseudomonadota bacterium]
MSSIDYNGLKVLIVDDQTDVLMILRNMLSELGVNQIFEASSGGEADMFLDTAADMINLIICDWNLPEKSGLDLFQKVREDMPNVPFIMVTGRSDINSVMNAKNCGVHAYIRKPFSLSELEKKIQRTVQDGVKAA